MGFISRKIFPACGSMCVCCPALRSRSRQPVKRYKKLLSEIFPKSTDAPPNERKIAKLCEYAAKNPFRIPKIAKYLEERCYKELRYEHIKFVNIVTEAYNKLLCMCKEQMACFAVSLLNVVSELLDNSKQDATRILGCETLTRFINNQADGTYTHSIEKFVHKVCKLAREDVNEHQRRRLRASSLQCLSAVVWFMAQYSYIFPALDEMVYAILDNYELDTRVDDNNEREPHHTWVDEVVRCEGRGAIVAGDASPSNMIIRPQSEKKDPSLLTREETETPKVWAQICIQRMVELAKETTTLRQVLDPVFVYFDSRQHWIPQQGLAMVVLSDMSYGDASGNHQLILAAVVRHLDHKNMAHDPQLKSYIVQVAAALATQVRSRGALAETGFVSDLCRHLRKSFQATLESVGQQESNLNILLRNSIEECLLEIAKGIDNALPLFNMMAISLEKLPSSGVVARATIGSLMIVAHMISLALILSITTGTIHFVFPVALLVQLMKAMLHPNIEVRVGAHQIFSALLIPSSNRPRHEVASLHSGCVYETRRWHSNNASAFESISALLEKLQREKDGIEMEKNGYSIHEDFKGKDNIEEDRKQGLVMKSSHNIYNITSIIDKTAASNMVEAEPYIMKLTEDQIMQLLSGFWIQATLSDNMPSNIEAISHSFALTLISLQLKNINDNLVVRFFQLPLSLKNIALDPSNGMLTPAFQRSILMLSMGMLMFAAKICQIPDLIDLVKPVVPFDADPYLGISKDFQVFVRPQADVKNYGLVTDNRLASSLLLDLRDKIYQSDDVLIDILVRNLSTITEMEVDDLTTQLSEPFTPDDAFMFGPRSIFDLDHNQMIPYSKQSLSFDEDIQTSSLLEDDARSEASVVNLSHFIPKVAASPSVSRVTDIGQLLQSALEAAGQVAANSVSTSPLPYDTMASQCEAFGTGTRKKLSNWLAHENGAADKIIPTVAADRHAMMLQKISNESALTRAVSQIDPCLSMRLPPASPFDNFLKAARC
ncbi:LOW QUALITY PROTEIN: protein SEMI-ROLLED LEAF 2-like [Hibiscus syriacus]|uniref:LOW QUALITY PROTEIN: protein SEMI-ROLLED LEAF 2-like n=1 Tax=Hibiscus syriacus TaxID=106335 RepID=UPI001925162C|nr:LOW QUALITY PROTEIN: protein SEMI-ROLLED LEAF 2-like [Hibiscus syriacus]